MAPSAPPRANVAHKEGRRQEPLKRQGDPSMASVAPQHAPPRASQPSSLAALRRGIESTGRMTVTPASVATTRSSRQAPAVNPPVPAAPAPEAPAPPEDDDVAAAIAILQGEPTSAAQTSEESNDLSGDVESDAADESLLAEESVEEDALDEEEDPEIAAALNLFSQPQAAPSSVDRGAAQASESRRPASEDYPRTPHYRTSSRNSASVPPAKSPKGRSLWQRLKTSFAGASRNEGAAMATDEAPPSAVRSGSFASGDPEPPVDDDVFLEEEELATATDAPVEPTLVDEEE